MLEICAEKDCKTLVPFNPNNKIQLCDPHSDLCPIYLKKTYGKLPTDNYVRGQAWKNGKFRHHPCQECDQSDMQWVYDGLLCNVCHSFEEAIQLTPI